MVMNRLLEFNKQIMIPSIMQYNASLYFIDLRLRTEVVDEICPSTYKL